jgi:anti-sigma factor RsiW
MKHIDKKRLSAFLDGEVTEAEKLRISEHLKSCDLCRKELQELSQVVESLDVIDETQVSPYFLENLKQRIAERERVAVIRIPFLEWVRRVAVPVGATALFILSFALGSQLGVTISQGRVAEASMIEEEFDDLSGISSLGDFPEGSFSETFAGLWNNGEMESGE